MIYDVYHGKELVIKDQDFSSTCHGRSIGEFCGGCGMCMEMQAYHSGYHLVKVSKLVRLWRDYIYYPVSGAYWSLKRLIPRKEKDWFQDD